MNAKQMKEFMKALDHIVEEKGIDKQIVIDAMEQAMAAAYKKNEGVSWMIFKNVRMKRYNFFLGI